MSRPNTAAPRAWTRHLEGWQPWLLAVFLAGSAAAIAVPRPVEPAEIPMPLTDARAIERVLEADMARAREAERAGLDTDVRALGSAVRAFGLVDADPNHTDAELLAARNRVNDAVVAAFQQGDEAVLRLRAFQLRSFIREVRRWEATGEETEELRQLGGDFLGLLRRSGWIGHGAGAASTRSAEARRVEMSGVVLAVLFKKRWSAIVGVQRSPFAPTLDEQRALYAFFLSHPLRSAAFADAAPGPSGAQAGTAAPSSPVPAAIAAQERRGEEQYRLKKIEELAALDPAYPRDLARGVVLYRLGRYLAAVEAFRRHLDASPEGPYALRARNYLRAALGRVQDDGA